LQIVMQLNLMRIKINGKVEGRVVASELLEVTSGGSVNGDIIT